MKTTQQYHLGNCFQNIFNKFYEVAEQLKEEESDTVAQVKRGSRARERDEKRVMSMMRTVVLFFFVGVMLSRT